MTPPAERERPLTVLRVIARLNVGGPARHVIHLNEGLDARGHRTMLAYGALGEGEASLEGLAREHGIRTHAVPGLGPRVSPLSDLQALLALVRLVFRESPDVVHTHTAKAGALGRIAALAYNCTRRRTRRCLVVHTFHGHVLEGYFRPAVNAIVRGIERALALVTDVIVTVSPSQRSDLVTRFAVAPASKIVAIPLGLDLAPLLALPAAPPGCRTRLSIGAGDVVVGYVGRMVAIKDLATLMTAFAAASRARPDLRLLLAGDGPERPRLEAQARELGIADRVRFLGWIDDLAAIYAALDICALSSRNEGTPVAVIEAMAAGKPVVATAVGGVADVVDHGSSGLLVPAGDVEALAAALLRLADDPALRREMGAAGRAHAGRSFSTTRLVDDVERLYREGLRAARV